MLSGSLPQMFARVFGAVYILVGIIGFIGPLGGTASQEPNTLLGIFGITLVHNIVHLAVGAAFLAGSVNDGLARITCIAIGVTYTLVGIVGLLNIAFIDDLLAINGADNGLHFATGILALVVAFVGKGAGSPTSTGGGGGYLSGDQRAKF